MSIIRRLGKSELMVSEVGLGCWAIGGPSFDDYGNPNGWSGNDDSASLAGLHKAYEMGINHWDTADVYGKGHSERLIGHIFQHGVRREEIILATKVGWHKGTAEHAFDPLHIRHQLEQSLSNLHTDYVDIYYFHNPFFGNENEYLEPAAETVNQLKQEGKIRYIGQSAYNYKQFLHVCPVTKPDVLQLPFNALKSPFDNPNSDIFTWADQQDLGIVMFGTYAKGILLGKYEKNNPPQFDPGDVRNQSNEFKDDLLARLSPALKEIKKRFGYNLNNLARVANQLALSKSKNAVVIPGFKNAHQVEVNARTMEKGLSVDDINYIKNVFMEFKKKEN
jgi:myo-inositol catabolism protein IolS